MIAKVDISPLPEDLFSEKKSIGWTNYIQLPETNLILIM